MPEPGEGELGTSRQQVIDALCEHFANDHLSVEEFERRVERAHRAESTRDLRTLLLDLETAAPAVRPTDTLGSDVARARASVPSSRVKERRFMVAALGGVERKGRWIPARKNFAMAVMGGLELDFREALLPPGVTEVWVFTLMGGAELIVPPGLSVESDGIAILGGFAQRDEASLDPDPDAPVLRLRGLTMLGGVEVSIRYPGESPREAKRRHRSDRKRHREHRKRLRGGGDES